MDNWMAMVVWVALNGMSEECGCKFQGFPLASQITKLSDVLVLLVSEQNFNPTKCMQAQDQGNGEASPPSTSLEKVQVLPVQGEVMCGDGAYSVLPADLRDLQAVEAAIQRAGLDTRYGD
eukprot:1151440-Pelagomonas_calceolata.AAC.3